MDKPIDANHMLFFLDLMGTALKGLKEGHSVTRFTHGRDTVIEFDVCIRRIAGKPVPQIRPGTVELSERRAAARLARAKGKTK